MDNYLFQRVQTHRQLSVAWAEIAAVYLGAALVDHSRIVDLKQCLLFIETDHPAWIQLLQTKQQHLLQAFQERFPLLSITGIAFRLSRPRTAPDLSAPAPEPAPAPPAPEAVNMAYERRSGTDADFIASLKRLEQSYRSRIAAHTQEKI
jgi:hypothetical protein